MSNVVVANGVIEVMADSLQSDIGNIELINAVLPVIAYFSLSGIDSIVVLNEILFSTVFLLRHFCLHSLLC